MLATEKVTVHTRLGFFGLGYMGSRIARRLLTAGFPLLVYNRDRRKSAEFEPQFPIRLMHKDFRLVLGAAETLGLSMPATEAAAKVNAEETATGGEQDFSAVIRRMEESAKEKGALPPAA